MVKLKNLNISAMEGSAARAADLLRALGHEKRLLILCHLSEGELSVGELARRLEMPQSPLSQHLARLRKEGLVETRREAQTIYYRIASEVAARIVKVLYKAYCA